jgi:hypothetical protein
MKKTIFTLGIAYSFAAVLIIINKIILSDYFIESLILQITWWRENFFYGFMIFVLLIEGLYMIKMGLKTEWK